MNDLFRILGATLALGCIIFGAALPACAAARSGDVVTVTANCDYRVGCDDPDSQSASTALALASPLRNGRLLPVYLAQGWERDHGLSAGMFVRAYVVRNGRVELADGIQLSDGRVMVDGEILNRAQGP